jgi:hypothetical protein
VAESSDCRISRPSLAQFSIRDLLWLMVWASLGSVAAGAVLPRLSADERPRFLVATCLALLVAATSVATALWRRARLERKAGPCLLAVPCERSRATSLWPIWLIVGAGLPLLGTIAVITVAGLHEVVRSVTFYWLAYLAIDRAIAARWERGCSLEVCERGLLVSGKHFIPAESVIRWCWGATLPNRLFVESLAAPRWEVDIGPLEREALNRVLEKRFPAAGGKDRPDLSQRPVHGAS